MKFAAALEYGVQTAYKAVMKPVEGTIFTVAKDAANKGVQMAKTTNDIIEVMEAVVEEVESIIEENTGFVARPKRSRRCG